MRHHAPPKQSPSNIVKGEVFTASPFSIASRTTRDEREGNPMKELQDNEISNLLTHIYQHHDTESQSDQTWRTLNIYIEVEEKDEEEETPPTVESTLDEEETPLLTEQPQTTHITEPHITRQQRIHPTILLVCLVPLIGILSGITYAVMLPLFTPSATVTIVATSQPITTTSTLQIVTNGTADPMKNQVPGRTLPAITMSEQKTVPTTGTTRQAAQAAYGYITFYNAAPYVQMVKAGTMIAGADGIQVLTEQDAIIPAAIMPTEGQTTVLGYAVTPGLQGNIRAGDLYGACCRLNVFVTNGAFHGGQDARTYQSVTPQDINSVVNSLKTSLEQSVQVILQTQVQATETLLTPLSCTSNVTPDHQPGGEATQVHVTINETCTGTTYNTQAVTTLATQRATHDATKRLGTGYTMTGVRIVQGHRSNHSLEITGVSLWAYPFSQEQQSGIKAMIAGMSKDRATATLLRMAGVQSVAITLKNSTMLPRDAQQIYLLFLQV